MMIIVSGNIFRRSIGNNYCKWHFTLRLTSLWFSSVTLNCSGLVPEREGQVATYECQWRSHPGGRAGAWWWSEGWRPLLWHVSGGLWTKQYDLVLLMINQMILDWLSSCELGRSSQTNLNIKPMIRIFIVCRHLFNIFSYFTHINTLV